MAKRIVFLLITFLSITFTSNAQITQTIRGVVTDAVTREPLPFATVQVDNSKDKVCITDSVGKFQIPGITVGRHTVRCNYVGFQTFDLSDVLVTSAKETNIDIRLQEDQTTLQDVVVRPNLAKENTLNKMVLTGGRMFSIEEASRYAGGFDDPARLASSFSGVATSGATNGISIHGNAPHLLSWRLEDIEIPNPNHFSDISVLGGGIFSSLSAMCIGNSDFLTSAFPAEYGNAVSGVFDMKMRNGNDNKHEHAFQIGVAGIDVASEGPLSKKTGASYLVNYRYSMTGLASRMNLIDMQGQVMDYQDLNFKFNLPTRKAGTFTIWGTGFFDHFHRESSPKDWESKYDECYAFSDQWMGAMGVGHVLPMKHGQLKSSIGVTYNKDEFTQDVYDIPTDDENFYERDNTDGLKREPFFAEKRSFTNLTARTTYTHRHSNRWLAQYGAVVTQMLFDVNLRSAYVLHGDLHTICENDGNTTLFSGFTSHSFTLNQKTTLNAGFNVQHLLLNGATTFEPRVSMSRKLNDDMTFALAYGLHSRAEKTDIYFTRKTTKPDETNWNPTDTGSDELVNKDLGFTKSHHLMATFGWKLSDHWNLKVEPFFQYLFNVPVEDGNPYSVLNRQEFYLDRALVNKGKGRNFGIDITLERYMKNGWYGMANGSFFSSKYKGGDGKWRHTLFDRNYIINVLGGKEWMLGRNKNNMLSINVKATLQGGDRDTPLDKEKTLSHPDYEIQYVEDECFSKQYDPMLIIHYTISYRINKKGLTHEFSIKHINCTGTKSQYGYTYDYHKDEFKESTFTLSLPNISYKIEF